MTEQEWRNLVGARIAQRRNGRSVRGLAKMAGISEGLWRQIESGRRPLREGRSETVSPKVETKAAVCRVLGWSSDSIDRLLAGQEPNDVSPRGGERYRAELLERVDGLALQVEALTERVTEQGAEIARLRREDAGGES